MKRTLPIVILLISCLTRIHAQSTQLPYFENFENGTNGWTIDDNGMGTTWQLGTPTFGFTLGAYSGSKCWDTNLNSCYQNNSVCNLISPAFDFSFISQARISFFTHYHTEYLWDYLTVQYTIDNGDHWSFLPFPNLNNPDGMTPKWTESALLTDELYGYPNVQFRFTFISDGSTIYDGFSIDDFRIVVDPLSAPEMNEEQAFSVYPNPSRGEVNFNFTEDLDANAQVTIYDATGKQVFLQKANNLTAHLKPEINLSQGIYTVVFDNKEAMQVKKLVVIQ